MQKTVLDLKKGEKALISGISGGGMMKTRLENMGIRPGKSISRVSSQFMGGPVIISVDGRMAALGRGMASWITVSSPAGPPEEPCEKR